MVRISVEDTGVGIAIEQQEKLFRKFTQVDTSPSRRHGGTGLGLAISKELAERMGGSIGVSSNPFGSTFWVDLPLETVELPKAEPESQPASLPASVQSTPSVSRRILIAEDNTVNQYVLSRSLQKLGYEVDIAENGLEAVKRWETTHYDAILMDCQMPEMDGYKATKTIRQHKSGEASIPIIAITAHAMTGDAERCRKAGMNGYLDKPLRIAELQRMLNQYAPNTEAADRLDNRPAS